MRGGWLSRGLALVAVVWCVAVGVWLWITPIRSDGVASTAYADSRGVVQQANYQVTGSRSFADGSLLGPLPLIIPVLITATGAWAVWRGRMLPALTATAVMLVFVVLGGFSIGVGYVPAVAALVWAAIALAEV
jgi:hypothetical protein